RMLLQRLLPAFVGGSLACLEIGVERCLHIDDEIARIRHVHDEIRPERSILTEEVQLLREIAVLAESGELHQPPQRELTPASAHFRTSQRGDEVARFPLQLSLSARERFDLRAQRGIGLLSLALERVRLLLRALERRAQRLDEVRDGCLALLEAALGERLITPERLAREAQEELAVGAQRLAGEGIERGAQARVRLLEKRGPLRFLTRPGFQAHARGFEIDAQRPDAPGGADLSEEESQDRAEYDRGGGN